MQPDDLTMRPGCASGSTSALTHAMFGTAHTSTIPGRPPDLYTGRKPCLAACSEPSELLSRALPLFPCLSDRAGSAAQPVTNFETPRQGKPESLAISVLTV